MTRPLINVITPLMLASALLLSGCAAQNAYREGRELASTGKTAQALSKFEEAAQLDNRSPEYRAAAIQTRDRLINDLLTQAARAVELDQLDAAKQVYQQVLTVQPTNARAAEGLRALEMSARHKGWLQNAQKALTSKDDRNAQMWARMVNTEDPRNRQALAILQTTATASAEKAATGATTGLAEAYRKPITIEFKDAPLRTVFEVIARTSGLNFLFDKDVRTDQRTSLFLKNSTIEAAVNLALMTNQLEQRVLDANTILIYPNTQAKQRDYQPLTVRTFYLTNAEAKSVANTLKTILKTRDVVVDDKLNMLIVRDSPQAIALAEKLVSVHDVPEPEVMLEVEILEVKRTRLMDLGIRWPDQLNLSPLSTNTTGTGTTGLTLADLRNLNSNSIGATIGPTTVTARKVDTDANILANPRIRARNREKAKILIGERVPNITSTSTSTGFVSESVNYVDVGLKLDVEPTIYPDGEVAIKVSLEVSNIINQLQTKSGSIAYQIGTRTAQTVLRLKDGENQVLAGLINDEDRRTGNKVPGFGEVPIIGRLFGNQIDDGSKTEIVLSITPRILRNVERPSLASLEFDSGTESSVGARATAPTQPPQPTPTAPPPSRPNPAGAAPTGQPTPTPQPGASSSGSGSTGGTSSTPITSNPVITTPIVTGPGAVVINQAAQLRWQGPTALRVGDTFALQLLMQADQPLVSVPAAIGYDPRVLQVLSVTEGDFLRQNGAQTSFTSRIDPTGQVLLTGTRVGDTGASSLATFATLNVRVVSAITPQTSLQLLTIAPVGLGGRSVATPLPAPHVISVSQ